jgi:hypothetical protein
MLQYERVLMLQKKFGCAGRIWEIGWLPENAARRVDDESWLPQIRHFRAALFGWRERKERVQVGSGTTSEGEIPPQDLKGSRIAHGTTM